MEKLKKKYQVIYDVDDAHGTQTMGCEAKTKEEAFEKFKKGESEFIWEEVEITNLGEISIDDVYEVDEFEKEYDPIDKHKEANEFIRDIAKLFGEDDLGYDDKSWTIDDFKDAIQSVIERREMEIVKDLINMKKYTHDTSGNFVESSSDQRFVDYLDVCKSVTKNTNTIKED